MSNADRSAKSAQAEQYRRQLTERMLTTMDAEAPDATRRMSQEQARQAEQYKPRLAGLMADALIIVWVVFSARDRRFFRTVFQAARAVNAAGETAAMQRWVAEHPGGRQIISAVFSKDPLQRWQCEFMAYAIKSRMYADVSKEVRQMGLCADDFDSLLLNT